MSNCTLPCVARQLFSLILSSSSTTKGSDNPCLDFENYRFRMGGIAKTGEVLFVLYRLPNSENLFLSPKNGKHDG